MEEALMESSECTCARCQRLGAFRHRTNSEPPRAPSEPPPPLPRMPASLYLAPLVALLMSCADVGGEPEPMRRFSGRPVHVQASSELSDECMLSLGAAVAYWTQRGGVSMDFEVVDPGVPSQVGVPVAGVIAVKPGKPSSHHPLTEHPHAEVVHALTIGGDILAAEITLDTCNPMAVTHEAGHALGLPDVDERGNVMAGELRDIGFALTDEQRANVADDELSVVYLP